MAKTLTLCLIFSSLFNVISWLVPPSLISKLTEGSKHNQTTKQYICKKNNSIYELETPTLKTKFSLNKTHPIQSDFYNFLPYETCNDKNNYLDPSLSKSNFLSPKMKSNELSPLCTFAGLKHKLKGAFQKSCKKRPQYTRHKPCLTKKYHNFVHNQITMAAECFHIDPKTLFSLYSTESFLQVNVKPSRRESAEGISQLMPQYAVKHINQKIFSNDISKDSQYKRNLRYFQSKAPNLQCLSYLKKLEKTILKKEQKNQCQDTSVDQKVSQDIYYSIAYALESIKFNIKNLINNGSLFNDDYSQFFLKQKQFNISKIINCNNALLIDKRHCLQNSKEQVQNYIHRAKNELKKAIKHLAKNINPIGINNFEEKVVNNFPQFELQVTSNQFKESKITKLLDNPFVKNYCHIDTIPQLRWYKFNTNKEKNISARSLQKDITKLLAEVRECKRQLPRAYMDIFHSMNRNSRLILNEVSFYQHNGGTKMNFIFRKYIRNLGAKKISNLNYKKFTGRKKGSFRHFIIRTDGPSQASNFLYNTPGFDNKGRRIAGSLASTSHNMKILKKNISNLKESAFSFFNINKKQGQYLDKISNSDGFSILCSHY